MSEEPRDVEPAVGAMWFPDEGGIMFRGKAYLPSDYIFSSRDVWSAKADALREAAKSIEEVDDRRDGLLVAYWLRARADVVEMGG